MTAYGWRPGPKPEDDLIYAGGVFRIELLHRVRFGAPVIRLGSRNAADLGWLNRYVVVAVCGCLCWAVRADIAVDQRQHCLACRENVEAAPADERLDRATTPGDAVRGDLWLPARQPDAVLQLATAFLARTRSVPGPLRAERRPLRRRQLLVEPDVACITATDRRIANDLSAAAVNLHAA